MVDASGITMNIEGIVKKRTTFDRNNPFYFLYGVKRICKYDGLVVTLCQYITRMDVQPQDIICVSSDLNVFLEIKKDKTMYIHNKGQSIRSEMRINAYSLNPPILALEDGGFVKVIENCPRGRIFEELPQLKEVVPSFPGCGCPS